ncbi:MAG TPA: CopD family protein [Sphingomicrobium sp.]|nr:CopD family protein [Sphingomicrobium sp.]
MTALLAAARAVHLMSLMTILGGSAYSALLRRGNLVEPPATSIRILFVIAAALALMSGLVWFCLIAGQMSGSWQGSVDPSVLRLAASATRFGHIFAARFIGLIGLCFLCMLMDRPAGAVLAILAGLLLVSLAPISHAAASGGDIAVVGAASDATHLLAAGLWLGGLMALALVIRRCWGEAAALMGPLRIFSILGTVVVIFLMLSGVANALSILPLRTMALHNPYFDLLLVKIALALVMAGLASLNRWRFAPAMPTGGGGAVRRLATSVGVELALGLFIVTIVGYLGTMAPH